MKKGFNEAALCTFGSRQLHVKLQTFFLIWSKQSFVPLELALAVFFLKYKQKTKCSNSLLLIFKERFSGIHAVIKSNQNILHPLYAS